MKSSKLKECIATLKKLRDAYHGQLDACVLAELESVINELQESIHGDNQANVTLEVLGVRALEVISVVIKLVTNVSDLMK